MLIVGGYLFCQDIVAKIVYFLFTPNFSLHLLLLRLVWILGPEGEIGMFYTSESL